MYERKKMVPRTVTGEGPWGNEQWGTSTCALLLVDGKVMYRIKENTGKRGCYPIDRKNLNRGGSISV